MKVFFDNRQSVIQTSYSPSAGKPLQVVNDWLEHFTIDIKTFDPATLADLQLVHEPSHIDGVFSGQVANGFDNRNLDIAKSTLWTVGSMKAAALYAFKYKTMAVSPTSGFHHAGYDFCGGYCTFNGLMVAASALMQAGAAQIAILDADMHYGNGTVDILEKKPDLRRAVIHRTIGEEDWSPSGVPAFLESLSAWLDSTLPHVQALIYQAGADPHIDDPLGGWMTTQQMKQRDRTVFKAAKHYGVPVVWNLAGGYQAIDKILAIHRNTMAAAIESGY